MAVTPDEFRAALTRFPSGVTVVTTIDNNGVPHGITVTAFCYVSLIPPLVLVCVEKTTRSHQAILESRHFVVNILAGGQTALSRRFALPAGDKFEGVPYKPATAGVPALDQALVNIECVLQNSCDGGDHTIFVGEVENVMVREGETLLYYHGAYIDLSGV